MKNIKSFVKISVFLFALAGVLSIARAEEKIIAIVNKEVITQRDLESFLNFMKIQLSKEYSSTEIDGKIAAMKADLLDRLIEDRLILQEAKRNDLKVDEARVKGRVDELKKRYDSQGEFENTLKSQGLVEADLEDKVREQILMYNIVELKVRSKVVIKPVDITEYYNSHPAEFALPESREFRSLEGYHEDKAKMVAGDLRDGRDPDEVAKVSGFTLNTFTSFKGKELKKELEDVLFNLKAGEVSEPVQQKDVYYVFQLLRIIPPHQQPLSEIQDAIHEKLYENKMQETMAKWVDEIKKKAYIQKL
jgi:peptidyl-prolyl cis-trans isomerase SurA